MSLIEVKNLGVQFQTQDGLIYAVNGINFALDRGQTLGIVGSSSGKSQSVLAMMGLLAKNSKASGQALYRGQDLLAMKPAELNKIRGNRVAMIFQDPMTSLNPYLTVERQMTEVLQFHKGLDRKSARARSVELLDAVKIPDAARRIAMYPHEFSGACASVMIAMALLCEPEVLIADEPTTALDVTVQAQIIALLRDLQRDFGTAIVMITHDLGVVAGLCDEVMVLYGGRVMEQGDANSIFTAPPIPIPWACSAPYRGLTPKMKCWSPFPVHRPTWPDCPRAVRSASVAYWPAPSAATCCPYCKRPRTIRPCSGPATNQFRPCPNSRQRE